MIKILIGLNTSMLKKFTGIDNVFILYSNKNIAKITWGKTKEFSTLNTSGVKVSK